MSHAEMQQMHKEMAERFGNQPKQIIQAAHAHEVERVGPGRQHFESALTYARDKNFERHAVADERELMRDALKRSMGEASFTEIRERFKKSIQSGDFIEVESKSPSRAFTTERMIQYERDNVAEMQRGQGQNGPLVNPQTWQHVQESHAHLSPSQRAAVEQIVSGRDKIMGLESVTGAGKTTSLTAIREAAECEGYQVIGLAPTPRAAHKLAESGIESHTLQRHLIRHEAPTDGQKRLFVIDESSLASTKQMYKFFNILHTSHRVLLVVG